MFFDVQKAFDSVPHLPLLEKLSQIGTNPYILRWLQNYLTERKQYVVVDGSCSPTLQVISGVPQGSVLGPLLFSIYLNDVAECISGGSKINLFADDIALYRTITSPDDYLALQSDVNAINSCLAAKHLTLNSQKCCYLFISRKRTSSIPSGGSRQVSIVSVETPFWQTSNMITLFSGCCFLYRYELS